MATELIIKEVPRGKISKKQPFEYLQVQLALYPGERQALKAVASEHDYFDMRGDPAIGKMFTAIARQLIKERDVRLGK